MNIRSFSHAEKDNNSENAGSNNDMSSPSYWTPWKDELVFRIPLDDLDIITVGIFALYFVNQIHIGTQ
jgi:hypothetical protein